MTQTNITLTFVVMIAMFFSTIVNIEQIIENGFIAEVLIFWVIVFLGIWLISREKMDQIITGHLNEKIINKSTKNKKIIIKCK